MFMYHSSMSDPPVQPSSSHWGPVSDLTNLTPTVEAQAMSARFYGEPTPRSIQSDPQPSAPSSLPSNPSAAFIPSSDSSAPDLLRALWRDRLFDRQTELLAKHVEFSQRQQTELCQAIRGDREVVLEILKAKNEEMQTFIQTVVEKERTTMKPETIAEPRGLPNVLALPGPALEPLKADLRALQLQIDRIVEAGLHEPGNSSAPWNDSNGVLAIKDERISRLFPDRPFYLNMRSEIEEIAAELRTVCWVPLVSISPVEKPKSGGVPASAAHQKFRPEPVLTRSKAITAPVNKISTTVHAFGSRVPAPIKRTREVQTTAQRNRIAIGTQLELVATEKPVPARRSNPEIATPTETKAPQVGPPKMDPSPWLNSFQEKAAKMRSAVSDALNTSKVPEDSEIGMKFPNLLGRKETNPPIPKQRLQAARDATAGKFNKIEDIFIELPETTRLVRPSQPKIVQFDQPEIRQLGTAGNSLRLAPSDPRPILEFAPSRSLATHTSPVQTMNSAAFTTPVRTNSISTSVEPPRLVSEQQINTSLEPQTGYGQTTQTTPKREISSSGTQFSEKPSPASPPSNAFATSSPVHVAGNLRARNQDLTSVTPVRIAEYPSKDSVSRLNGYVQGSPVVVKAVQHTEGVQFQSPGIRASRNEAEVHAFDLDDVQTAFKEGSMASKELPNSRKFLAITETSVALQEHADPGLRSGGFFGSIDSSLGIDGSNFHASYNHDSLHGQRAGPVPTMVVVPRIEYSPKTVIKKSKKIPDPDARLYESYDDQPKVRDAHQRDINAPQLPVFWTKAAIEKRLAVPKQLSDSTSLIYSSDSGSRSSGEISVSSGQLLSSRGSFKFA